MKTFAIIAFSILVLGFVVAWVAEGQNFFLYKFWAPKYEDVRRETYTHTQSFRQGQSQRLGNLCHELESADEGHQGLIKGEITQEFAEFELGDVPAYLRGCLRRARDQ